MSEKTETRQAATTAQDVARVEPSFAPPLPLPGPVEEPPWPEPPWSEVPWVQDADWENDPRQTIFRKVLNDDGEVEWLLLPPTLENLLNLEEGDKVTQSNPHARTANPIDDVLRRRLERPGVGVFYDLQFRWDSPVIDDPPVDRVSPDVAVVFDLKRPAEEIQGAFWVSQEGVVPSLVIEVVSATYRDQLEKDYRVNRKLYAAAGVRELIYVEPFTDGPPRVRRFEALRLDSQGKYQDIQAVDGRRLLKTVGLTVHVENSRVVFCDAKTGERLLTAEEEEAGRRAALERADAERQRADGERQRADETLKELLYERDKLLRAQEREADLRAEIERLKRPPVH